MVRVAFHLDFISPYAWLALMRAPEFAKRHGVEFELHPVVYAALLDAHGLVGPAETAAKRRYTFHDVVRLARRHGLEISGPPAHPFRSLEALRTLCLFREDSRALELAVALSNACWGHGRDLTDIDVLAGIVDEAGFDAANLADRISNPETKQLLRSLTESAIDRGVFGVPTFVCRDEMFWGHDRLELLGESVSGTALPSGVEAETFLERPRGADRPGAPRFKRP